MLAVVRVVLTESRGFREAKSDESNPDPQTAENEKIHAYSPFIRSMATLCYEQMSNALQIG